MANYTAMARSNYFRVIDRIAFVAWCKELELEFIENDDNKELVGFLCECEGGLPSSYYDEETEEDEDFDFYADLAKHIAPGEVAVVEQVGWEKMRYLTGSAAIVTSAGLHKHIDLDDIAMEEARTLNANTTACQY